MSGNWTRRKMLQASGITALSSVSWSSARSPRATAQNPNMPKICLGAANNLDEKGMNALKQIGVEYVLMGGPRIPWEEADIRARLDHFRAAGITVCNMMISGFNDVIWGKPGADEQIELFIKSIRAAGKAGLPVIEYNFYGNRLIEGYKEELGRGGAGYTAYDYEISRNLPPREDVGTHSRAEQMKRAERFLKAVVPEAEKAGTRLALHPNDPPVPLSRGSEQIMAGFEHWKQYLNLVKSP